MAEDLGVSPSYLNLLERNQRPVTAQVLLRLADTYDLDLRTFSADREVGGDASLTEVFSDGLFQDLGVSRHEVAEVADNFPGVAQAVLRLYQAYVDRRRWADVGGLDPSQAAAALTPSDWVRDFIQNQRNYLPDLEEQGETLAAELRRDDGDFAAAARERLLTRHSVKVQVVLGSATMPVSNLLKLGRGAVIPLDHRVGEPVDVVVNGRIVARGEVVVVEDDNSRFGISLTEIVGRAGTDADS